MTTEKIIAAIASIAARLPEEERGLYDLAIRDGYTSPKSAIFGDYGMLLGILQNSLAEDVRKATARKSGKTAVKRVCESVLSKADFGKSFYHDSDDVNGEKWQLFANAYRLIALRDAHRIDTAKRGKTDDTANPFRWERSVRWETCDDQILDLPDLGDLKAYVKLWKATHGKNEKPMFCFGADLPTVRADCLADAMEAMGVNAICTTVPGKIDKSIQVNSERGVAVIMPVSPKYAPTERTCLVSEKPEESETQEAAAETETENAAETAEAESVEIPDGVQMYDLVQIGGGNGAEISIYSTKEDAIAEAQKISRETGADVSIQVKGVEVCYIIALPSWKKAAEQADSAESEADTAAEAEEHEEIAIDSVKLHSIEEYRFSADYAKNLRIAESALTKPHMEKLIDSCLTTFENIMNDFDVVQFAEKFGIFDDADKAEQTAFVQTLLAYEVIDSVERLTEKSEPMHTGRADYYERKEAKADYYKAQAEKARAEAARLQKPINDMRGDVAFFTQPNINSAGGRAFTRQREKMFASYERGFEALEKAAYYERKAETAENNSSISSDDPEAVRKIKEKIAKLEAEHEAAKQAVKKYNAEFDKNVKSGKYKAERVDYWGNPITEESSEYARKNASTAYYDESGQRVYKQSVEQYTTAEIRRLKDRLETLQKTAQTAQDNQGWTFDGGEVVLNASENRIQIIYDDIPSEEVRKNLKTNGFKWSRKNSAWQRMLNTNGIYAAKRVAPKTA